MVRVMVGDWIFRTADWNHILYVCVCLQSSVIEMLLDTADEDLACEVYDEDDQLVTVKQEHVSTILKYYRPRRCLYSDSGL